MNIKTILSRLKNIKLNKPMKILIITFIIIVALIITGMSVFKSYYNRMNIQDPDSNIISNEEQEIYDKNEKDETLKDSNDETVSDVNNNVNNNVDKDLNDILNNSGTKEEISPTPEITKTPEISFAPTLIPVPTEKPEEIVFTDDIFNILLIGSDGRTLNERGRSDSMMVCSINKTNKTVTLTSILRDCYVSIPGYKNNRINAAYAYGGTKLLIETIEQNFKIDIHRYARVNFFSFMDIVDYLGGVDMELSDSEIKVLNDYLLNTDNGNKVTDKITGSAGVYHLNGNQTLAYSRNRYSGNSDFARTERQRKVLLAIKDKMKDCSFSELNKVLIELLPYVTTDLTEKECLDLLLDAPSYLKNEIQSNRIPYAKTYEGVTIEKKSVLSIDFEKNIKYFYRDIYGIEE